MQESVSIRLKADIVVPKQQKDTDERVFWTIATSQVVDTQKEIIDMKTIKPLLPIIKTRGMAVNLGHFGINVGHSQKVWLKTFREIMDEFPENKKVQEMLRQYDPKILGLVTKNQIYRGNKLDDLAWEMVKDGRINGSSLGLQLSETDETICDSGGCGKVMKAGDTIFELALTGKGIEHPIFGQALKSYDPSNPTSLILRTKSHGFSLKGGEKSPKGGITLGGKFYPGGQFIPKEDMEDMSSEDKKKLENAQEGKKPKKELKPWKEREAKKPKKKKLTKKEKFLDKPWKARKIAEKYEDMRGAWVDKNDKLQDLKNEYVLPAKGVNLYQYHMDDKGFKDNPKGYEKFRDDQYDKFVEKGGEKLQDEVSAMYGELREFEKTNSDAIAAHQETIEKFNTAKWTKVYDATQEIIGELIKPKKDKETEEEKPKKEEEPKEASDKDKLTKVEEAFATLHDHFKDDMEMIQHVENLRSAKLNSKELKKSIGAIDERLKAQKLLQQAGSDLRKFLANKMGLPDTQLEKVAETWDLSKIKKLQKEMKEEQAKGSESEKITKESQRGIDRVKERKKKKRLKEIRDRAKKIKQSKTKRKGKIEGKSEDFESKHPRDKGKFSSKKTAKEQIADKKKKEARDKKLDDQLSDTIRKMKPHEVDMYVQKLFTKAQREKKLMEAITIKTNTSLKGHKNNTDGAMYNNETTQDGNPPHEGEYANAQIMKMMASIMERLQALENLSRTEPVQQEQPMGQAPMDQSQQPMQEGQQPMQEEGAPMETEGESPFAEEGDEEGMEEESDNPFAESSEEGEESEESEESENKESEPFEEEDEESEEGEENAELDEEENAELDEEEEDLEEKSGSKKNKKSLESLHAKMDMLIGTDDDEDVVSVRTKAKTNYMKMGDHYMKMGDHEGYTKNHDEYMKSHNSMKEYDDGYMKTHNGYMEKHKTYMKGYMKADDNHEHVYENVKGSKETKETHDADKGEHEHEYDQQHSLKCAVHGKPKMKTKTETVSTKADDVETKTEETKVSTKSADGGICSCGKHEPTVNEKETKTSMKSEKTETEESITLTQESLTKLVSEQVAIALKTKDEPTETEEEKAKRELSDSIRKEIYAELGVKSVVTPVSAVDGQINPAGVSEGEGATIAEIVKHFSESRETPSLGQLYGFLETKGGQ